MVKWILAFALLLGVLLGFLIKSGITLRTGEESAVRPGNNVETYQDARHQSAPQDEGKDSRHTGKA